VIYFMQPVDGGPVKIGCSEDVEARRKSLESHYGCDLVLLGTREGTFEDEQQIHERFAHLRFGRTEQFRPAADLMAFIGRPLLVDVNPDAVEAIAPRPWGEGSKKGRFAFRARPEWLDWLNRFANFERSDMVDVIDRALEDRARAKEFEPPPKR
jgi:hypothetical protein